MKNIKFQLSLYILLLILTGSCQYLQNSRFEEKRSEDHTSAFHWEYATPESQGFSAQKLDKAKNMLAKKGTKKLLIIKNDKIIFEWSAAGWEDSVKTHYTASLAKAIVGGLSLACALDDERINLDEPACERITEWKEHNIKSKITY